MYVDHIYILNCKVFANICICTVSEEVTVLFKVVQILNPRERERGIRIHPSWLMIDSAFPIPLKDQLQNFCYKKKSCRKDSSQHVGREWGVNLMQSMNLDDGIFYFLLHSNSISGILVYSNLF